MQNQRMGSPLRLCTAIAVAGCMLPWPGLGIGIANAQRNRPMTQMSVDVALMAAPREIIVLLNEAELAIKNEQWSEATLTLGLLLGLEDSRQTDQSGVDFFIDQEDQPNAAPKPPAGPNAERKSTVFQRVYELIESLPSEATKFVDLRYGLPASQMLERAIADSDWEKIADVASKYGFTSAGQDAMVILGQHWLQQGESRRGARALGRVFRQKSAVERLGPQLGILAASAFQSAGMQAQALSFIESTRSQFNRVDLDWKGNKISWDGRSVLSKELLEKLDLGVHHTVQRVVNQPHYVNGNPNRNADTNAGVPLPTLRWHAELHESQQHKDNLGLTLKAKLPDGKSSLMGSRYPISVGPWVIATTYDQRIVAIDTLTGLLSWECPYSGMPMGFSMDNYLSRDSHSFNLPAPDYLAKRVWGESLLGAISSDGERLYNISELPAIDVGESFALGPNARVAKPKEFQNYNVLQCWSVREEGKAKWEVGGQKSKTEPQLAGTLFLGSPLPYEGELLVLGELNGDLYLIALAPETGKLLWRQPITTNSSTIAGDLLRRSTGAMPAVDGSIIVCPTLSGYLVAFDKSNRTLLWAFNYQMKQSLGGANQVGAFGQVDRADFSPLTPRSADTSVVISDGVVLFAPTDGSEVYGISIEDGSQLWKYGDARSEDVRYVAGAWKDSALIVCQTSMVALDLKTGAPKWPKIEFPDSKQLVGRGVRHQGSYLVPTSGQTILQIDLANGKLSESVRVEQPLGNLISVGDRLICATPFELDCYSVREAFQTQLKLELQRNSVSVSGLAKQSELAIASGDFDAALNFLDQARKIDANNAEVSLLINKVGIAALTADFEKYVNRVEPFQNLLFSGDKVEFLRLMVTGLQKMGRYKDTLVELLKLSRLRTQQRQEQMSGVASMALSSTWSVQEDRWISAQVRKMMEKLTPSEIAETREVIFEELESLKKQPSHVRRLRLAHFESIRESEALRLESAETLVKQRDYLQAERLLTSDGFLDLADPKSVEAQKRRDVLAKIYVATKRLDVASRYLNGNTKRLEELMEEFALMPNEGAIFPPLVTPTKPVTSKPISEWPTGKVQVATSQIDVPALNKPLLLDTTVACKWKQSIGDVLNGWEVHAGPANLVFSRRDTGESFLTYLSVGVTSKQAIPTVYSVDSIVLVEVNQQIIAIDTLRGSSRDQEIGDLWREQFEVDNPDRERERARLQNTVKNWGLPNAKSAVRVVSVSRSGIVILRDDELLCLDVATGTRLWKRTGFKGCSFATEQNRLRVHDPKTQIIMQLNLWDGDIINQVRLVDEGWNAIASIGRYWLMEEEGRKQFKLRLIDSKDGRVVFTKEFAENTKIALDGETGVVILRLNGELTYWNLKNEKEFVTQVESDIKFSQISLQRFGETMLVMLFGSAMELDNFSFSPDKDDPNFSPVAGRVFALSSIDATPVWEKSPIVRQFYFPIAQNRNSPVAVFVRMVKLSKVAERSLDFMSIAVVDVRNGHVVYTRDDLPAIRGLAFSQEFIDDQDTIVIDYLGSRVELNWTKEPTTDKPVFDFGDMNASEFKKRAEGKRAPKASATEPAAKNELLPIK